MFLHTCMIGMNYATIPSHSPMCICGNNTGGICNILPSGYDLLNNVTELIEENIVNQSGITYNNLNYIENSMIYSDTGDFTTLDNSSLYDYPQFLYTDIIKYDSHVTTYQVNNSLSISTYDGTSNICEYNPCNGQVCTNIQFSTDNWRGTGRAFRCLCADNHYGLLCQFNDRKCGQYGYSNYTISDECNCPPGKYGELCKYNYPITNNTLPSYIEPNYPNNVIFY